MTRENRHQPHPWEAATCCRHSYSKTQGVKWSEPVHMPQGRHILAPLPPWSIPMGLGQSWTVKNLEGTATGRQEGPHPQHPEGTPLLPSSRVAFPSSTQATEWIIPGLYPAALESLAPWRASPGGVGLAGWGRGAGRWGGPCLPARHPGQQPQPQLSPTSLLSSWMWSVPFSLSSGPPCLTTSSVATLTKASSTLLESLADVSMAHRMS